MIRKKEIQWFYQDGACYIYPDAWEKYKEPIPENEHGDFISAYYKQLTSNDKSVRLLASKAWANWEATTSKILPNNALLHHFDDPLVVEAFARIECHYFINCGFFDSDAWILDNIGIVQNLPIVIIHGRHDVVCPLTSAWDLQKKLPKSNFHIIEDAGHSMTEEGIAVKLIEYTDKYSAL